MGFILKQALPQAWGAVWGDRGEPFRRSRAGVVAVAFLAPFSASRLLGSVTVGRTAAVSFAVLLALDLLAQRRTQRLGTPAMLLIFAYVGLFAWIFLSSATWGCNCDGKMGGFAEFAFVGVLAVVAISVEPRLRRPALAAAFSGIAFATALALLGVGSLNSGTVDLTQTGGRLSGTYGNANELGFAIALAIPVALAYLLVAGRGVQIVLVTALVVLGWALVLTYSRGGIVAAAVGVLVVTLWTVRASRRQVAIVLSAAATVVLVGAALYSMFERERQQASFGSVPTTLAPLDQRDLSGWDSRALEPIPDGPSRLFNLPGGFAVAGDRAGEGVSFRWGEAEGASVYVLHFRARVKGRGEIPFAYALGDGTAPSPGVVHKGTLSPRWRSFSLRWRPRGRAPQATVYVWQRGGPVTFELTNARVVARSPDQSVQEIELPRKLDGSIYDHLTAEAERAESRYLRSRLDAARLAVRAFRAEPIRGIGWSSFPDYADEELDYGQLAAHDEYLGFAAELGVVGVLLFALLLTAAGLGVRRVGNSQTETAAIGVLAAGAAGLVFVEALPIPQLSIPLALALAIVCAPGPLLPRRSGRLQERAGELTLSTPARSR